MAMESILEMADLWKVACQKYEEHDDAAAAKLYKDWQGKSLYNFKHEALSANAY